MNKFWANITFAGIAAVSLSTTGCDAIKKLIAPRMEKPTIGTRTSAIGSLDIKTKTKTAKYLGCDLNYSNMPAGAKVNLTWYVFNSEADQKKGKDRQHTDGKDQDVRNKGVINAYLQSLDAEGFAPGIYECRWEADASGKKVEGGEQSASIVVGDLDKVKGGGGGDDDDDTPKKKKKSKKSDDDE